MIELTVDVEEWFHVPGISRRRWASFPHRARECTLRLLDLLGDTKATFFVLGYVARREPSLVREIVARGHRAECHGDLHRRVDSLTPEEFRADVRRASASIADACGRRPVGFRAPEWSHTRWSLDVLAEEGFEYDSSVLSMRPKRHRRGPLLEIPVLLNGTMLRVLPLALLRRLVGLVPPPAVIAVHPWEFDPDPPRGGLPLLRGFVHDLGLGRSEARLRELVC